MVKNFQGRKEISAIWLAIEGDCREYFIHNYQKEISYQFIAGQQIFALIKYFNRHPTASKIILECMEKNKLEKDEKNFYINLMELPKKPRLFISDELEDVIKNLKKMDVMEMAKKTGFFNLD